MDEDNYSFIKRMAQNIDSQNKAEIQMMLSYSKNSMITNVPDPYYGGNDGFEEVLDLLEEACDCLLLHLETSN